MQLCRERWPEGRSVYHRGDEGSGDEGAGGGDEERWEHTLGTSDGKETGKLKTKVPFAVVHLAVQNFPYQLYWRFNLI